LPKKKIDSENWENPIVEAGVEDPKVSLNYGDFSVLDHRLLDFVQRPGCKLTTMLTTAQSCCNARCIKTNVLLFAQAIHPMRLHLSAITKKNWNYRET
jgi:hypothetical protein